MTQLGTAFWVSARGSQTETNQRKVFLVTAKHVVWAGAGPDLSNLYYRLNNGTNEAQMVQIPGNTPSIWLKDETVDIIAMHPKPPADQSNWMHFPLESALNKDEVKAHGIEEGEDVFFVGLFSSFYGKLRNTPIFRFGKFAMMSDERVPWVNGDADLYLMETQSYPGNSGSPVFFKIGSLRNNVLNLGGQRIYLAGIMSGYFGGGELRPIVEVKKPHSLDAWNLGIAGVTPAHYLRKLLDQFDAGAAEKQSDKK